MTKRQTGLYIIILITAAVFTEGCRQLPSESNASNVGRSETAAKNSGPGLSFNKKNPQRLAGRVVHISDGDTFIVEAADGGRTTVRIHAIDAPELSQTFGRESREELRALIANQTVEVQRQKIDQFHRIVGVVFLNGKDVGLEMVSSGYAWHFKQYQKEQLPETQKAYSAAEETARGSRLGLWRDGQAMPPQDYRRTHKNPRDKN